jgi:hypothetical protein
LVTDAVTPADFQRLRAYDWDQGHDLVDPLRRNQDLQVGRMAWLSTRLFAGWSLRRSLGQRGWPAWRKRRLGQVVQPGLQFRHFRFQDRDPSRLLATAWTFLFHTARLAGRDSCNCAAFPYFADSYAERLRLREAEIRIARFFLMTPKRRGLMMCFTVIGSVALVDRVPSDLAGPKHLFSHTSGVRGFAAPNAGMVGCVSRRSIMHWCRTRDECSNKLHQPGIALHNTNDTFKQLPPMCAPSQIGIITFEGRLR